MANPARYLLPTERVVINIRRHWAVLAAVTVQSFVLLLIGLLVARFAGGVGFLRMLAVYFTIFVIVRWVWSFFDWYVEKLVVTDKRVLLITGIVTRKVAIMPLVKVTDLTFNRSATGLLLGYGQFVVETAGQDQALSSIDFVPRPERLYIQISELLFGGDKGAPGALVTSAQREAEQEAELQARRRWRRFTPRRRRRERDEPGPAPAPEPSTSDRLDDLLARRDTLLADRDVQDFGPDSDYGDRDGDFDNDLPPGSDGTGELRLHEPRRGGSEANRNGVRPEDLTLPPRPREDPPAADPADD
jgi:membrane protein YdbS with pleckstrin-like domain